jgi:hypothetical protein
MSDFVAQAALPDDGPVIAPAAEPMQQPEP